MPRDIVVLTHIPSPYQVELFNCIQDLGKARFTVIFLKERNPERSWGIKHMRFEHVILGAATAMRAAEAWVCEAELAVFNYYANPAAQRLMGVRQKTKKPWSFWGERPGFRLNPALGSAVRRWKLRHLHNSRAPIWGIGSLAVEGYRREFGQDRAYRNIPYFSDLERFHAAAMAKESRESKRTILYSGSMIERKGLDLLAAAFRRIAPRFPEIRLLLAGSGELRRDLERQLSSLRAQVECRGFVDWVDLPKVYAEADVLCAPSRYDGWGLVVPEGLAAGLPVISTDRTGAAVDLVEHGRNGWMVPADNEGALAEALAEACAMPRARLEEMSRAAQASVQSHSLIDGSTRFVEAAESAVKDWRE